MMQEIYNAGLYCRLSQDDGNVGDSSSIQTQKMMLEKYCKDNNFKIYNFYQDDGFSGTNFNRPSFQRLLKDIDSGKINLVITKDLSRLGRDYIMTGYYTELYFPDRNVRYIAINDNIDTLKNDNDIAPFKNILNDIYIRDLSRKIKTSLRHRAMQGMFTGSNAPYGYKKDLNNKNKLIIDNETVEVVKRIFGLVLSGYGTGYIAKLLTKEKILTPATMKLKSGDTRFQRYVIDGYECKWNSGSIYRMITNPVYTGDMVSSKTQIINYKTKKSITNSKDKRIVVLNTHEAIITKEDFERVQVLCKERHLPRKNFNVEDLFKGLVKCSVCDRSMVLTVQTRRGKTEKYYRCFGFANPRTEEKHWTSVKYDDVKEIITTRIKEFFVLFKDDDKLISLIQSKISETNSSINYEKELSKVTIRQNTLSNITKKVYDDYFEGLINHDTYHDLIKKYQNEQNELKDKHNLLLTEKNKKENYLEDINKLKEVVNSFLDFKELTQEMVYSLIEKIEISSIGGFKQHKQRTINIAYRFLKVEI